MIPYADELSKLKTEKMEEKNTLAYKQTILLYRYEAETLEHAKTTHMHTNNKLTTTTIV